MNDLSLQQMIPVIQMAVGPVILISGVGLLLLSLTNRYGRIIDRARSLIRELPHCSALKREQLLLQLNIIHHRARLIRVSIILATSSVLFAGLLIISLFLAALAHREGAGLVSIFFILCIASLLASLVVFLIELQASLKALRIELREAVQEEPT